MGRIKTIIDAKEINNHRATKKGWKFYDEEGDEEGILRIRLVPTEFNVYTVSSPTVELIPHVGSSLVPATGYMVNLPYSSDWVLMGANTYYRHRRDHHSSISQIESRVKNMMLIKHLMEYMEFTKVRKSPFGDHQVVKFKSTLHEFSFHNQIVTAV